MPSLPTVSVQRAGVKLIVEASAANDRLASCVLSMCAFEGTGITQDVNTEERLLAEAADAGSNLASDYLARRFPTRWGPLHLRATRGLDVNSVRAAEQENLQAHGRVPTAYHQRVVPHPGSAHARQRHARGLPDAFGRILRNRVA